MPVNKNFKQKRYNDYSSYFRQQFSERIQKISIDAGFTCPNRDGTKAYGGCLYCDNNTFNPFYCTPKKTITDQLDEGIAFFSAKYKTQKYLAYFQAYTNTYAPFDWLTKLYEEALHHKKVIGLVIATRPDCINDEILDYLAQLSKNYYIVVEYGVESTLNKTLELVNRCHTFEESVSAIEKTAEREIHTGVHLILGLPGENKEIMLHHANKISMLPVETLKLHQLQIICNTPIAGLFNEKPHVFPYFTVDEYIELVSCFIERLNPTIIIERFISESPPEMLISPKWNRIKNFEIVSKIERRLEARNTWQGWLYNG